MTDTKVNVSVQANVIRNKEKIKPGATFQKANSINNLNAPREGVYCRCNPVPLYVPRHSGRYPWKDDDNEIREVFNMDSYRLNRLISVLNAAGGNFEYETAVGEEAMATIKIPAIMLDHLHIDGDGSFSQLKKIIAPKIPAINNIQTFNDRAVQITFADGTQTKSVCGKDETFDLYEGIAFCLFKRFLGKDGHKGFNDLMRYAFKKLDEQEKAKAREAEIEAEKKRHEEKKKRQAERRKARKREEKIGIFVEALRRNREIIAAKAWGPMVKPDEPPAESDEKTINDGGTLFLDPLSGETFISSRDKILLAVAALNNRIIEHSWVSVNEWYEELGLNCSGGLGEIMGWNIDRMLKIDFADDITRDGRECYTIIYDKMPVRYEEGKA